VRNPVAAKKLPVVRARTLDEVGTARFRVPQGVWVTLSDDEKHQAWHTVMGNAMRGAFGQHPDCLFAFDFKELHPDPKELLDPKAQPEIVGECHVTIFKPLS
jgi:hypothetical protein